MFQSVFVGVLVASGLLAASAGISQGAWGPTPKRSPLAPSRSRQLRAVPPAPDANAAERHLRNVRKLTSGGENAEAYFSPDGTRLIYQSTRPAYPCDQIYTMK